MLLIPPLKKLLLELIRPTLCLLDSVDFQVIQRYGLPRATKKPRTQDMSLLFELFVRVWIRLGIHRRQQFLHAPKEKGDRLGKLLKFMNVSEGRGAKTAMLTYLRCLSWAISISLKALRTVF